MLPKVTAHRREGVDILSRVGVVATIVAPVSFCSRTFRVSGTTTVFAHSLAILGSGMARSVHEAADERGARAYGSACSAAQSRFSS